MPVKAIGYAYIVVGTAAIIIAGVSVYLAFTNQWKPYDLFTFEGVSLDFAKFAEEAPANADLTQEIVSPDKLNKPLNLMAHLILMGFIAGLGFKIATIGTYMVREIQVKVRVKDKSILDPE
jgi:hypothetical protein